MFKDFAEFFFFLNQRKDFEFRPLGGSFHQGAVPLFLRLNKWETLSSCLPLGDSLHQQLVPSGAKK